VSKHFAGVNMKIIFAFFMFFISACGSKPIVTEFDDTKKVQVISLNKDYSLYAQNDVVLEDKSLTQKLSAKNPEWENQLTKSYRSERYANIALVLQFASLFGCIAADETQQVLGWCLGSIAIGLTGAPARKSAAKIKKEVVTQYNSAF
jgi:hypothetical protein